MCAYDGAPASAGARGVMAKYGIGMDDFRSAQLTPELIRSCDLIVGMTESHCRAVRQICPEAADRCHLLLEWGEISDAGVPDPYSGTLYVYERCFAIMKPALDALFRQLNSQEDSI
ncbi:hypothetical protein SDC9_172574 [bioreactor metagenome]|uniref:Phosphotyrosine protein phosphatase I domain-containing protein n=1 Tax=bioreactor metagenome TaxID=1076179 RepID=A0A645GE29_9ZZZZ